MSFAPKNFLGGERRRASEEMRVNSRHMTHALPSRDQLARVVAETQPESIKRLTVINNPGLQHLIENDSAPIAPEMQNQPVDPSVLNEAAIRQAIADNSLPASDYDMGRAA